MKPAHKRIMILSILLGCSFAIMKIYPLIVANQEKGTNAYPCALEKIAHDRARALLQKRGVKINIDLIKDCHFLLGHWKHLRDESNPFSKGAVFSLSLYSDLPTDQSFALIGLKKFSTIDKEGKPVGSPILVKAAKFISRVKKEDSRAHGLIEGFIYSMETRESDQLEKMVKRSKNLLTKKPEDSELIIEALIQKTKFRFTVKTGSGDGLNQN